MSIEPLIDLLAYLWPIICAKTPNPNLKNVFFSSLALSAVELWRAKVWPERANYAFSEKLGIRPKTGFLAYNFRHRCASKSIKGSYRCRFSPSFQQNFEPKEWINGLGPRAGQRWPTFPKHVLFVMSPSENPHRNRTFFFSTTRLAESVEGLNSSLAQSPGEL